MSRAVAGRGIVELTHQGSNMEKTLKFQVYFYLPKEDSVTSTCMRMDVLRGEGVHRDCVCTGPSLSCYTPATEITKWSNKLITK